MSAILFPFSSITASILITTSIMSSLLMPLNFTTVSAGILESESVCKSGLFSRPTTTLLPLGGPHEEEEEEEDEEEVESKESFLKVLSCSLSFPLKLFCSLLPSSWPCWCRNRLEKVEEGGGGGGEEVDDAEEGGEFGEDCGEEESSD